MFHEFWNGLLEGKNGVGPITKFDTTNFDTKFAAEVKNFNPEDYFDKKSVKRMDPFSHFALVSSGMAYDDSGINGDKIDKDRFGVIYGSGIGGIDTLTKQHIVYFENNSPQRLSPFFVTMMISDMAAGLISIKVWVEGAKLCNHFSLCNSLTCNCRCFYTYTKRKR